MKPIPSLLAILFIAIVAIGCGGSGITGGTSTGGAPPNAVRQNINGDQFIYTVQGTYTAPGAAALATIGSAAEAFKSQSYSGILVLGDALGLDLQVATGSANFADTKLLTSSGLTAAQSDDGASMAGTPYLVTSNPFTMPTSLSATYSFSGTEGLFDGTTVQVNANVTGFKSVGSAAGAFSCWTISKTSTWSDGLTVTETIQFSPTLGAAVQRVVTATQLNGYSYSVTETLASYTFGTPGG